MKTQEYESDIQVWQALAEDPSLAILHATLVPTREGFAFDESPVKIGEDDFYLEDKVLPDNVYLEIQNPFTGNTSKLKVIGVIESMVSQLYVGWVITSQDAVNILAGYPMPPTSYWFQIKPDRIDNIPELANSLEAQFPENGMSTSVICSSSAYVSVSACLAWRARPKRSTGPASGSNRWPIRST